MPRKTKIKRETPFQSPPSKKLHSRLLPTEEPPLVLRKKVGKKEVSTQITLSQISELLEPKLTKLLSQCKELYGNEVSKTMLLEISKRIMKKIIERKGELESEEKTLDQIAYEELAALEEEADRVGK